MRIRKLIKSVSKLDLKRFDFDADNAQDKFNEWWNPVRVVLSGLKGLRLTGRKSDAAIGKVIALGDLVYEGHSDQYSEFINSVKQITDDIQDMMRFVVRVVSLIKVIRLARGKRVAKLDRASHVLTQAHDVIDWIVL